MARHAFRIQIGAFRISEDGQIAPRRRRTTLALCGLAVLAGVMLWLSSSVHHPAPAPAPVAHAQPLPAPTVATVQVSGATGAICIMPTGKAKPRAVELVKLP